VGDWVYLRLQPYRQNSIAVRKHLKLSPRFFGPFKVLSKIGIVAYKLDLPSKSRLQSSLSCLCLEEKVGPVSLSTLHPASD
jgi:hypothetical protein